MRCRSRSHPGIRGQAARAEDVVDRLRVAVVRRQRSQAERALNRAQQAVVRVTDGRDVAATHPGGTQHHGRDPLRRALMVVGVFVEGDDGQRSLGAPGRGAHDLTKLVGEEPIAGADAATLHVIAIVDAHPDEVRSGGGARQVATHRLQRQHMGRAVGRAQPDVSEVQERQIVVPVVPVDRVVTGPGGALVVGLPALVGTVDEVADVGGTDRVLGVRLQGVGQRNAEDAATGQRQIVAVAGMLFGVELVQLTPAGQQAVVVGRLSTVADDGAHILILEVEEEHVVVARDVHRGRPQRRHRAQRRAHRESQVVGHGAVIAHGRRVGTVDVVQSGRQAQGDRARVAPAGRCPVSDRAVIALAAERFRPPTGPSLRRASSRPADE